MATPSNDYLENGFAVFDGFSDLAWSIKQRFHHILSGCMTGVPPLDDEPAFARFLIGAYRTDKPRLMEVYAVLDRSFEMVRASCSKPIVSALNQVGLNDPVLSSYPTWRLDVADNPEQRWFPWHQEKYHEDFSDQGVTIWMPLHDVGPGLPCQTIYVRPGSHKYGVMEYGESKFDIIDKRVSDIPEMAVELESGQCVVFSNFLVHRSGVIEDQSGLRMSLQFRYDDLDDPEYKARGWPANYRIVDAKDPRFFQRYCK